MKIPIVARNMVNDNVSPSAKLAEYACTILARDWKGVNNYGFNLIIEEENDKQ